MNRSFIKYWRLTAGILLAGGLSAAILFAQAPTMPQPGVTQAAPTAPQSLKPLPGSPLYPIPFGEMSHGPVRTVTKRTPDGKKISYYQFIYKGKRTYQVTVPVSQTKAARSKDEWVTLFSVYGVDSRALADTRSPQGAFIDHYASWMRDRIKDQTDKIVYVKQKIQTRTVQMTTWSAVYQEAKDDGDKLRAQTAWGYISRNKRELRGQLNEIAGYKLQLGNLYKDSENYEAAREQYRQTALLLIWPYSAKAIAKLRVIEGAQPTALQPQTSGTVGVEKMSMSALYQASIKAATTTP